MLTIPGHFGLVARRRLEEACRRCGIGLTSFITEAEAALIYHISTNEFEDGEMIVLLDLGSITTSCAVGQMKQNKVDLILQETNKDLGGADITRRMSEFFKFTDSKKKMFAK